MLLKDRQRVVLFIAVLALTWLAASGCGGGGTASSTQSPASAASAQPEVAITPASYTFSDQVVNSTSSPESITLTNSGAASLSLTQISASGDFAQTNNCGSSLAAGSSCTINVTFTPTATGNRTGALNFSDNAAASPQSVALAGTGIASSSGNSSQPAVTIAPASYTFSSQVVNSTSSPGSFTLTNSGNASLSLTQISVSGDFAQTNNCGSSLAAGSNCTINVTFTPTTTGNRTGALNFSDNAAASPQSVALYGTGVAAGTLAISPSSLSFGDVVVGQTTSLAVTITNSGGESVTISSASASSSQLQLTGLSTPLTLAASQSKSFDVSFTPSASGSLSASIQLANNSAAATLSLPVTGSGVTAPSHSVTLKWSDSGTGLIGYNAYRGTVSGGPYSKLTSAPTPETEYADVDVTAGDTYYYVVTAVASDGVESGYSSQVSATIPTP